MVLTICGLPVKATNEHFPVDMLAINFSGNSNRAFLLSACVQVASCAKARIKSRIAEAVASIYSHGPRRRGWQGQALFRAIADMCSTTQAEVTWAVEVEPVERSMMYA